jgi:hypothetical protein
MPNLQKLGPMTISMIVLIAVIFGIGWWWCWRTICEDCPDPVEYESVIFLDDDYAAVWQVIDNHFTEYHEEEEGEDPKAGSDWENYVGVLFQFGDILGNDCDSFVEPPSITIVGQVGGVDKTLHYSADGEEFFWINFVPTDSVSVSVSVSDPEPKAIFSDWIYALFPSENTPEGMSTCERVDPKNACNSGEESSSIAAQCLRNRTLRAAFDVKSVMTYWVGKKHYDLKMEYSSSTMNARRGKYWFNLQDSMTAFVWSYSSETGEPEAVIVTNVEEIQINNNAGGTDHGDIHWPIFNVVGSGGGGETIEPLP